MQKPDTHNFLPRVILMSKGHDFRKPFLSQDLYHEILTRPIYFQTVFRASKEA